MPVGRAVGISVAAISPSAVVGAGFRSGAAAVAVAVGVVVAVGEAVAVCVAVALAVGDGVELGSGAAVGGGVALGGSVVSVGSGGTNTGVGVGSCPPQAASRRNRIGRRVARLFMSHIQLPATV